MSDVFTLDILLEAKKKLEEVSEYSPAKQDKYLVEHYSYYGLPFYHPKQQTEKTAFSEVIEQERDYCCEAGDYFLFIPKDWVISIKEIGEDNE